MKKICFVTTISSTLKAFVLDTAIYLHEKGDYNITFICDYDENFKKSLPDYITYIPIRMNRGIDFSGFRAIYNLYKLFKKNEFDLIQYSTPNASFYAAIASKFANIPIRLYCQWGIVYVGFKGIRRKLLKIIEKIVCNFSTWIEPDSLGNLYFSHEEGLYTFEKSSVVWNGSASGVNLLKFDISQKFVWRKEIREKLNIDTNVFLFGFVGRITGDKGINELLESCRKLFIIKPNTSLLIVGDTDKSDSVNENLYKWSLSDDKIIYCGRTNEVEKYLSAIDVFILPSYREGFGSVVIEAEAMGVPVIVTDIPGPTDAMVDGKTGIVVKKSDVKSLLEAQILLCDNINLGEKMGEEGYHFAKNRFEAEQLKQYILEDRNKLLRGVRNEK